MVVDQLSCYDTFSIDMDTYHLEDWAWYQLIVGNEGCA